MIPNDRPNHAKTSPRFTTRGRQTNKKTVYSPNAERFRNPESNSCIISSCERDKFHECASKLKSVPKRNRQMYFDTLSINIWYR